MQKYLFLAAVCLLLLAACAAPQSSIVPNESDKSKPNLASIYYYLAGSLLHYDGDYTSAGQLYKLAAENDPLSFQIKKQILINSTYAYVNRQISNEIVLDLFNKARTELSFDADMLNAAYIVYNQAGDQESVIWVIDETLARFPSSRAYLQKFYLDYAQNPKTDTKYLDKAYKLAAGKPDDLILVARMYALVNPKRAIPILIESQRLEPKKEAALLLNELYLQHGNTQEASTYFRSYSYPENKEAMLHFIQTANKHRAYQTIISLLPEAVATADASILSEVAFAAYLNNDSKALNALHTALQNKVSEPEQDAKLAIFLLAQSLFDADMAAPQTFGDMLFGIQDVDDMMLYRTLRYTLQVQSGAISSSPSFYDELIDASKTRLPDAALSRYLIAANQALSTTDPDLLYARDQLCESFVTAGRGYENDWTTVLSAYHLAGKHEAKINLLRAAIERFPKNALFLNDLGYSLLDYPEHRKEAGDLISMAIAIEPNNAFYQDSMAWFYMLQNEPEKAYNHIHIPMQMQDMPGEIAYHIGVILIANNDRQSAVQYFKLVLADPDYPQYHAKAKEALTAIGADY